MSIGEMGNGKCGSLHTFVQTHFRATMYSLQALSLSVVGPCRVVALWLMMLLSFGRADAQINTQRVLAMGRSALFYEDYVVGLQYFTMCINAKPYLGEPYYYRALSKFYLGDYLGAESDACRAYELNPYISNLLPLRAICRVNLKHYADAEDDYLKILAKMPNDVNSWHNLLLCQVEQKAYERADSCVREAKKHKIPANDIAALQLVVDNARLGVVTQEASRPSYGKGLFDNKQSQDVAVSIQALYALNYYPSTSSVLTYEAFYGPVDILNHKGIFPCNIFITNSEGYVSEDAIRFHEHDIISTSERIYKLPEASLLYLRRAMDFYHTLNFESAISDLNQVVALDSLNFLGYFLRAQSRASLQLAIRGGHLDGMLSADALIAYGNVIDDLKTTIRLEPQFPYAYYNLGTIYLQLHDYDQAEYFLTKAIEMDVHMPSAYYNRGVARMENKMTEAAMSDLSEAAQRGIYSAYNLINRSAK